LHFTNLQLIKCDHWTEFTVSINTTFIDGYYNQTIDNVTTEIPIEVTNTTVHKYIFWDAMQKMRTLGSDYMILIRYLGTEDSPIAFSPYCFTDSCKYGKKNHRSWI